MLLPRQIGVVDTLAVTAPGAGLIATTVVEVPVHPFNVALTVYIPVAAVVTPGITGFCVVVENELGPAQRYVAPPTVVTVRLSELPAHIGLLLPAVSTGGPFIVKGTCTRLDDIQLEKPEYVIVTCPLPVLAPLVVEPLLTPPVHEEPPPPLPPLPHVEPPPPP